MNSRIAKITREWKSCKDCSLHKTAFQKVHYRGKAPCQVLFIGEAPGKTEDMAGEPFVGLSGEYLDYLLEEVSQNLWDDRVIPATVVYEIGLTRTAFSYGITNAVACLPLNENREIRKPETPEIKCCSDRLWLIVEAAKPQLIVLLGSVADQAYKMLKNLDKIPSIKVEHPAYVLRQGGIGSYQNASQTILLSEAIAYHLFGQTNSYSEMLHHAETTSKPQRKSSGGKKQNAGNANKSKANSTKQIESKHPKRTRRAKA